MNPKLGSEIPLFKIYPQFKSKISRIPLIDFPTPLQKMEHVSQHLSRHQSVAVNIFVKRDDMTNKEYGGNKARKYEFILPQILAWKRRSQVFTVGGYGTNHGLAFAIFGRKFGLTTHLFLVDQPSIPAARQNLLCSFYYGAKLHYTKTILGTAVTLLKSLILNPWNSYFLSLGGTTVAGVLGYINAGLELAEQISRGEAPQGIDRIYVTVGTMGMFVGIYIGLELAFHKKIISKKPKLVGVTICDESLNSDKKLYQICKRTVRYLKSLDSSIPNEIYSKFLANVEMVRNYYGGVYGIPTYQGLEAAQIAEADGIHLDPVYTAKTFSVLLNDCRKGIRVNKDENILFWFSKNQVDLTSIYESIDYRKLPKQFHKIFQGEDSKPVSHEQ